MCLTFLERSIKYPVFDDILLFRVFETVEVVRANLRGEKRGEKESEAQLS
jgi:hypothetical protein